MRTALSVLLGIVVVFVLLVGCAAPASPSPAAAPGQPAQTPAAPAAGQQAPAAAQIKPMTLKFAHYFATVDFRHKTTEYWAKLVEKKSNGAIKVELYPSESLVKGLDGLASTAAGVSDAYSTPTAYVGGPIPLVGYFDRLLPAYNDAQMLRIVKETKHILDPVFEKQGVKMLGAIITTGPANFYGGLPIHTLEDMQGKKIRGAGGMTDASLKALGAAVTTLSAADIYMGLQSRTVDGTVTTLMTATSQKLWEVAPYWNDATALRNPYFLIVNLETWKGAGPAAQNVFDEATNETQKWMLQEWAGEEGKMADQLTKQMKERYTPSQAELDRWRTKTGPVTDEWIAKAGPAAKEMIAIGEKIIKGN